MEPKAQAAERLLRGLGVAVKTFALYPLPHAVTSGAIDTLLASLRQYTDAYGPFSARVAKYTFTVDGIPFKGGAHANLALYFFTRKIAQFKIMPAVSDQALSAFVSAVGMDRASLEAAGGVRHLLRQAGVGNIQVIELVLEQAEEESEALDLSGIFEVLGRGRASPQEREGVIEILRGGPGQARLLLENVSAMAGGTGERPDDEEQVEQVYQLIRSLDRLVLDEPFEDRPQLYASLAGAQLALREPLRTALIQMLIRREGGNGAVRWLGQHLSSEQLAQVVQGSISDKDVAQQVMTFLRALCTDQQKIRATLAILDARLRPPDAGPDWLTNTVWPQLRPSPGHREAQIPAEFEFGDGKAAADAGEADLQLRSARVADEASANREVGLTLVDILRHERDERDLKEIHDITDALAGYLGWLADQQEYALLAVVLAGIRNIAASEGGIRRTLAAGILKKTAEGPVAEGMLTALWAARGTTTEREIGACLEPLADDLVNPLVRALGNEQRSGVRAMLCDLIIHLYGDRTDDLARFVSDPRWYLVRNIANILGRLRNPEAVTYLSRLVTHPDYRVRRETLNALASIGTEDAQAALGSFLDDTDERLRLRAIQSIDAWEVWRAIPRLLAILEQRDPLVRRYELKAAALEALARLGAKQSLPAVKRIAGSWFLWGRRGRELRRIAADAAAIIEGRAPMHEGPRRIGDDKRAPL